MLTIRTTGLEDYLDPEGGNAWVQAIIIGGHGVGKTPFAAKWPRPIFAMAEHGTMSIARDKKPYAEIYSDADMDAFITEIRRDCAIKDMSKRKYMTAVVDTIDAYQKRLMDHRVTSQQLDRFTGWDNWDWLDSKVSKVLRALSSLPIHLVVNMHYKDQIIGEGDDKTTIKEGRLKGDMKNSVYQEFDLIGFMETYYATDAGQRVRKHRIRWWPEPGYEMVRDRSGQLPQYTEVAFAESDFQTIFNHIVEGVDGLSESEVVTELPVEGESAAGLPAPDEGAGPVAEPVLPPAKKAAARKAPAKKAAAKTEPPTEPAPDLEVPADAPSQANGKGTATEPVVIEEARLNALEGPKYAALDHVHSPEGRCLKSNFEKPCPLVEHPGTAAQAEPELPVEDPPEVPEVPDAPEAGTVAEGHCGYQPESLRDPKTPPKQGCGAPLTAENKAPLAVVKYRTQLCQECFKKVS